MTWQVRYPHDETPEWREIGDDEAQAIARLHFGELAQWTLDGDEWRVDGAEFRRAPLHRDELLAQVRALCPDADLGGPGPGGDLHVYDRGTGDIFGLGKTECEALVDALCNAQDWERPC